MRMNVQVPAKNDCLLQVAMHIHVKPNNSWPAVQCNAAVM